MKKVLFLNPPSFGRFDGAGTRYQATRKTNSLFYPVWLCYAAGLIENSKVIDCPAMGMKIEDLLTKIQGYDIVVMQTTAATFKNDIHIAEIIKEKTGSTIVLTGAHVSVLPEEPFKTSRAVDFVARREYDYTIKEIAEGKNPESINGLSWRKNGAIIHNLDRQFIEKIDDLPFVSKVYKRDLPIGSYRLPQIRHPYVSIYSARGCPFKCSFCLWPQTFLGRQYRVRSPENIAHEIEYIKNEMPEINEILFEDDTFTVSPRRIESICKILKPLKIVWSANARGDVSRPLLEKMKAAGCRLLIVGYESGCPEILKNINKGITIETMRRFTQDCHELGIFIHGCFIFGLPGETRETIKRTVKFAEEVDCESFQGSVATPFPGTEFYSYCQQNNFIKVADLADDHGYQNCVVEYPSLRSQEIVKAVDDFHIKYLYRPRFIYKQMKLIFKSGHELERIIHSGWEFQKYITKRLLHRVSAQLKKKS